MPVSENLPLDISITPLPILSTRYSSQSLKAKPELCLCGAQHSSRPAAMTEGHVLGPAPPRSALPAPPAASFLPPSPGRKARLRPWRLFYSTVTSRKDSEVSEPLTSSPRGHPQVSSQKTGSLLPRRRAAAPGILSCDSAVTECARSIFSSG